MSISITDLKKALGPGLGLRKNRFLMELPVPGIEGRTLNILCRSAGLPERNINNTTIWHKGRQYNVRGETDYVGDYEISIVDDSDMRIRKVFDTWLEKVDNSKPANAGILGASFEKAVPGFLSEVESAVKTANQVKNLVQDPKQAADWFIGVLAGTNGKLPAYQTDINIWQLGNSDNKVYGYKLQNAFPKSVGIVTLDDGDENTLSEFSVNLCFSEFIPLVSRKEALLGAVMGDQAMNIMDGVETLFD